VQSEEGKNVVDLRVLSFLVLWDYYKLSRISNYY
jgi:hypothetical protein